MNNDCLRNPTNKRNLVMWGVVCFSAFFLSILLIFIEHGFQILGGVLGLVGTLVLFIAVPWRLEFLWRPTMVEVTDHDVVLYQRYGRQSIHVPMSSIKMLNLAMVEDKERNWWTMDGALRIEGRKNMYYLNWRIALAVREAYKKSTGHYPINQSEPHIQDGLRTLS